MKKDSRLSNIIDAARSIDVRGVHVPGVTEDDVRRAVVCLLVACSILGKDWRTDLPKRLAPFAEFMSTLDLASVEQEVANSDTGNGEPVERIVAFYESFLSAYDNEVRHAGGVWETPEPVVSFMVRSVDILLKEKFGLQEGLGSDAVEILDPCTGTGTFLRSVIKHVGENPTIGRRMHGVEIALTPWALAVLLLGDDVDLRLGNALDEPRETTDQPQPVPL